MKKLTVGMALLFLSIFALVFEAPRVFADDYEAPESVSIAAEESVPAEVDDQTDVQVELETYEIVETYVAAPSQAPIETISQQTAPVPPDTVWSHLIITALQSKSSDQKFVELYNPTDTDLDLRGWRVVYQNSSGTQTVLATINGKISAKGYVLAAHENFNYAGTKDLLPFTGTPMSMAAGSIKLFSPDSAEPVDQICWNSTLAPSCVKVPSSGGFTISRVYDNQNEPTADFAMTTSFTPSGGNFIPFVNLCAGLKITEIAPRVEAPFVEIHNFSGQNVSLEGCKLQFANSTTKIYEFGAENLAPSAYRLVKISDTPLAPAKTTGGTLYLLDTKKQEVDSHEYASPKDGTAWAWLDGDDWRLTYHPTPGAANIWQEFPPCEAGYERNHDTGRCRKIVIVAAPTPCAEDQYRNPETGRCKKIEQLAGLTPCKVGQERNPETNRCRNIASSTKELTPCKEGQERNPETNRCRNVATAAAAKPCQPGWERNPETNRCRKIVAAQNAQFAVNQAPASRETGLWMWAGIAAIVGVVGYIIWQFRAEIAKTFRKFAKNPAKS